MSQADGLLSRWQQRKEKVEQEQQELDKALLVDSESSGDIDDESAEQPVLLTADELPDPEQIEIGGSFAGFMADNIDPAAKIAALRTLWKQPQYNEIDGLLEYALDYTDQAKLTVEHSAEITKKIFKHMTNSDDASPLSADELQSNDNLHLVTDSTESEGVILEDGAQVAESHQQSSSQQVDELTPSPTEDRATLDDYS